MASSVAYHRLNERVRKVERAAWRRKGMVGKKARIVVADGERGIRAKCGALATRIDSSLTGTVLAALDVIHDTYMVSTRCC